MTNIQEIWKDIQGYEGLYQISNLGRVKGLERYSYGQREKDTVPLITYQKEKVLKFSTNKKIPNSYLYVTLSKDAKKTRMFLHRLLGKTFIPNPENKPHVNHINGIKNDNRLENLEWVTCMENMHHFVKNSGKNKSSKFVGVRYEERNKFRKWGARVFIDGERKDLGWHYSENEAAQAIVSALKKHGIINKYA